MKKSEHKEMTILEASNFFDEHDIFEFDDVVEVKEIKFKFQKKKYIGLDMELFQKIQSSAKRLRIDEDALITEWLMEKVG